jgi:hypothetical protein
MNGIIMPFSRWTIIHACQLIADHTTSLVVRSRPIRNMLFSYGHGNRQQRGDARSLKNITTSCGP